MDFRKYIARRVMQLTSPVAFQMGYATLEDSFSRLCELATLAKDWGSLETYEMVKAAMRPIREKLNKKYDTTVYSE